MVLPVFGFVTRHRAPLADGVACEAAWMATCAATGRASAHLWQGRPGLVVPRSYERLPGWADASRAFAVQVRASGGGLVPQGPGVWNLSLVWTADGVVPTATDALYRALCDDLAAAFARVGVAAEAMPVDGSFCDGRFNLAHRGRKFVGTAQSWRRVAGRPLVLAHAVIVVSADPAALTAQANDFEAALGSARRYRADALTSVALAAPAPDIEARTLTAIAERFARLAAPHVHQEVPHGLA